MQKHTTNITSKSIERSGLPSDYKKAIAEYIWNGFDANANTVEIKFDNHELGYLFSLSIKDNGDGININNLDETFGRFMDSNKISSFNGEEYKKGKKGKGRFAYSIFCNRAEWRTVYKENTKNLLAYTILIDKSSQESYYIDNKTINKDIDTGTEVVLSDFYNLKVEDLKSIDFVDYLSREFGWFLFLHKDHNYSIKINGDELKYESIIMDNEVFNEKIGEYNFKITFIRWGSKIGEKYYYFFLNEFLHEAGKQYTSFNNRAIDFHHSLYIESDYFNDFRESEIDHPTFEVVGKNQADYTYKYLIKSLNVYINNKEREFIKSNKADKIILAFQKEGVFPPFKNNSYDQMRKADLESVIKGIYCAQPKIFTGLKKEQSKTLIGFLNLLIDTDQREKILEIMEGIIHLNDIERDELASVLRKTKINKITNLLKLLENRFTTIELLKKMVFDLEKFTNERDHIQVVVENNYWIFGEQYHLVSADVNFETVLNNYLYFIDKAQDIPLALSKEKLNRPDIFICRQSTIPDVENNEYAIEENIIVELKRPSVVIGKKQYNQIEDYMRFIIDEPQFNSQFRKWKFILVGKKVDSYILDKYESQKNKGKKFLVESIRNFDIYAMTWDDIFKLFEVRYKHLIDKVEFRNAIIEELNNKGLFWGNESSDDLTRIALE